MSDETVDYTAVLAAMEAQRAKLDSAIAALREWLSVGGSESAPAASSGSLSPAASEKKSELPTKVEFDTFFSLSIPEAIKKYLAMTKRPQSVGTITEALRQGGLSTTATDLMGTVTATLSRMRKSKSHEVVIVRRGEWGLTEWYRGGRRFDKPEPKKSKKRNRKAKQQAKAPAQKKPSPATDTASPQAETEQKPTMTWKPTPDQIEQIKALHAAGKKPGEISKETGVAAMVVGRIVAQETKPTTEAKAAS